MSKPLARTLLVLAAITFPLTIAFAREPAHNVGRRHPNLDAAQNLTIKAFEKVEAAQRSNEFDLGGHAGRAKDALRLAADEMKLAAEAANRN